MTGILQHLGKKTKSIVLKQDLSLLYDTIDHNQKCTINLSNFPIVGIGRLFRPINSDLLIIGVGQFCGPLANYRR